MIPQESCHGCMQGKHSKVGYHTYANKICNLPIGVFQYGDTMLNRSILTWWIAIFYYV